MTTPIKGAETKINENDKIYSHRYEMNYFRNNIDDFFLKQKSIRLKTAHKTYILNEATIKSIFMI